MWLFARFILLALACAAVMPCLTHLAAAEVPDEVNAATLRGKITCGYSGIDGTDAPGRRSN